DKIGRALIPVATLPRRRQVQYRVRAPGQRMQCGRIVKVARERYPAKGGNAIGLGGCANEAENLVIAREPRQRAQRDIAATNDQQPVHSKIVPALIAIVLAPAAKCILQRANLGDHEERGGKGRAPSPPSVPSY